MAKKLTFNEVISFIKENSDCIPLFDSFDKTKDKIKIQCGCGKEFITTFNKFKTRNKRQCNNCGRKNIGNKTKYNIDYIIDYVNKNSDCKLLSTEYNNAHTDMLFKCGCSKEFYKTFNEFQQGRIQCSECGIKLRADCKKITPLYIMEYIENNNCKFISGNLVDRESNIVIQCKCGNTFTSNFKTLSRKEKCQCNDCSEIDRRISKLNDTEHINTILTDDFELISDYKGMNKDIVIKHKKCGQAFQTTLANFKKNECRCVLCERKSKGEVKINKWLLKNKINYIYQQKYEGLRGVGNGLLSYDFYLTDNNLLIEFQGKYHDGTAGNQTDEQFEIQKEHDKRKGDYAELHNINLLEIWYWDYDNVEEILDEKINNIKGENLWKIS